MKKLAMLGCILFTFVLVGCVQPNHGGSHGHKSGHGEQHHSSGHSSGHNSGHSSHGSKPSKKH